MEKMRIGRTDVKRVNTERDLLNEHQNQAICYKKYLKII